MSEGAIEQKNPNPIIMLRFKLLFKQFSTIPLNLCFTLQANLPDSPYFSLWLMFVLSAFRNCFVTTNLVDSDADVFQTYALMLQKSKQPLLKRDRKKQQPNWFYGLKTYITREDEN